jgi:predicted RNA-binding Zn-ribbon protein involved in translation (DUF1610 family)
MPIDVKCEECEKTLRAPDSASGKNAKCPGCGAKVHIPEQILDAEIISDDESVGTDSQSDSRGSSRRPCPSCGEMILAKAVLCRYCKEVLNPRLQSEFKKRRSGDKGSDEDLSTGDWIAATFIPPIGGLFGIVWMIQGKPKGLKMIGVCMLFGALWSALRVIIRSVILNQV